MFEQTLIYKQRKAFDSIVKGFFLFYLSGIPRIFNLYQIILIPNTLEDILNMLIGLTGWYFVIKGWSVLSKYNRLPYKGIFRFVFSLYIIIVAVMILRGYFIDYEYPWLHWQGAIYYHLFEPSWLLAYIMVLLCLIPVEAINFNSFIKYAKYAAIIAVLLTLFGWRQIIQDSLQQALGFKLDEDSARYAGIYAFFVPFFFACLCYPYAKKRDWQIALLGFLASFFLVLINARRSSSAIAAIVAVGIFLVWVKNKKKGVRFAGYIVGILFIGAMIYLLWRSSMLDYMMMRGLENSRSGVDDALRAQMSPLEKIFGKGLNGRYYFYLEQEADYRNGWRYSSETGFYTLVLRGGYLLAFTYITLLVYPALKGLFQSNNTLCKCLGFYILISVLDLFAFGPLSFNFEFLIIWIGIALCLNKNVRQMNNTQIKQQFF